MRSTLLVLLVLLALVAMIGCHRQGVTPSSSDTRVVFVGSQPVPEKSVPSSEPCGKKLEERRDEIEELTSKRVVARCFSGNVSVARHTLEAALVTRVGDPFDLDVTTRDIKALYALGTISDIEVLATLVDGGVHLRYLVRERPWIKEVNVVGMSSLSPAELRSAWGTSSLLDEDKLQETATALSAALANHGAPNAKVRWSLEPQRENAMIVTFSVGK